MPELNRYETVYVLRSSLNEKDASVIHDKFDSVVKKFSGDIENRDDWGIKQLAYEIDGERSGRYCVVNYSGQSGVVKEIERHFKILPDVVRYITVCCSKDYDYKKVRKQIIAAEEEGKRIKEQRSRRDSRH